MAAGLPTRASVKRRPCCAPRYCRWSTAGYEIRPGAGEVYLMKAAVILHLQ
jgi:hypothetical protein